MTSEKIISKRHTIKAKAKWENIAQLVRAIDQYVTNAKGIGNILSPGTYFYETWKDFGPPAVEETFLEYQNRALRMVFGKRFASLSRRIIQLIGRIPYVLCFKDNENKGNIMVHGRIKEYQITLSILANGSLEKPGSDLAELIKSYLNEHNFRYNYSVSKDLISKKKYKTFLKEVGLF